VQRHEALRECHAIFPIARKRAERSSAARHEIAAQPPARTDSGSQAFGATN